MLFALCATGMYGMAQVPFWKFALPARWTVAFVLCALGAGVALAGVRAFRRAKTTVNPFTPEKSSALVVQGVYRLSRNPMYLGMLLALAGWAYVLGSVPALVVLPMYTAYMNRFQIQPEECLLAEKFGDAFAAYQQRVRRWV